MDLATADPDDFSPAMRQGVACALNADPTRTFWGDDLDEEWGTNRAKLYGCRTEAELSEEVRQTVALLHGDGGMRNLTAREWMETLTAKDGSHSMPRPTQKIHGNFWG